MNGPKQIWTADMVEARDAKLKSDRIWYEYQRQSLVEHFKGIEDLASKVEFAVEKQPSALPWRFILILALLAIVGYFITNSLLK